MILNKLHVLKTVYECGNASKASEALNVTRSAISQNISKLEKELGVSLFTRTPKGLVPTSTAHELAKSVSPLLDQIADQINAIISQQKSHAGTLHVGAPALTGTVHLPKILEIFHEVHPGVEIRLTLAYSNELVEKVLSGHLDLSLIDVFGGVELQRDFHTFCHCEPVLDEMIVMVCSPKYFEKHVKGDLSYTNLCRQDFLSVRKDTLAIRSWFYRQFGKSPSYLKNKLLSENGITVLDCACRGLGLCVFGSNVTQQYVDEGKLVEIHVQCRGEKNQISVIQLLDRKPRQIEKDFINVVKAFAQNEWEKGI